MYKVIKRFRDKHTHRIYDIGDSFLSDDEDRISNLIERKLIEGMKTSSTAFVADNNAFQLMSIKELESELRKQNIEFKPRTKKADLIDLLLGGD